MQPANYYDKLKGDLIQCQLCSHFCPIKEKQVGICRVRKNLSGKLYSIVYGYPVAQNIDPIEKKPLFHFLPGSLSYSLGTFGCNFKCANCQNWDISQIKEVEKGIKGLSYIEAEKIVEQALMNDCKSISYTYNEPTIWTEYALAIMKLARRHNLKNIWVSNGYMSKSCLEAITPYLDAINVDLKSFDDDFYKTNCQAKIKPVLENLRNIERSAVHLEITTLIVPTLSDDLDMIKQIANFIFNELGAEVPWHLSKFSPDISWKLKRLSSTPDQSILQAYEQAKAAGLKYIYVGNIPGDERENTYCAKCGQLAIRRFGYEIERLDNHGKCYNCESDLAIIDE